MEKNAPKEKSNKEMASSKADEHPKITDHNETISETLSEEFDPRQWIMGHPSRSNSLTLEDAQKACSPDEFTWLIQQWIQGELFAFEPRTVCFGVEN